jgi:hypothetical protein
MAAKKKAAAKKAAPKKKAAVKKAPPKKKGGFSGLIRPFKKSKGS